MATVHTETEPSLTELVSGILNDLQELIRQQLALFRQELSSDLRKTRDVAISWAIGLGLIFVAGWLLLFMLVHLLNWATEIPLWSCFGLVGLAALLAGAGLFYLGKKKLDSFNPLPDQSVQALKENVQCLMNPK